MSDYHSHWFWSSQDVFLLLHVTFKWALIVVPREEILELAADRVVFPFPKVGLGLVSEHPVLLTISHVIITYLSVDSVDEVGEDGVEEELVVADSRGHVLLLEDFVVVEAELEVARAVPMGDI